jgi:hypothetical protein
MKGKRQLPEGAVVKFRHRRERSKPKGQVPEMGELPTLAAKGGVTSCVLILPGGVEIYGTAQCNSKENYSKRLGRDISLGRALAQAEKEHPELFKTK